MTVSKRQNLIGKTRIEMQRFFVSLGVREFHARQVLQWIYQRGINDFSQMTDLSKALRDQLQQLAQITIPETVSVQQSSDSTRKWLLRFWGRFTPESPPCAIRNHEALQVARFGFLAV